MITTLLLGKLAALLSTILFGTWTTPRTWVPGELVTASMMNTHVRDNLNAVKGQMFSTQSFRGVCLRTHPDADKATTQVALTSADEIVMSDSFRYQGISSLLAADSTVNGAAGLDTGTIAVSTWYEIHVIGKSSTLSASDLKLMLHRAPNNLLDTSFTTTADANRALRRATSTATDRLAEGVTFAHAGPLMYVDILSLARAGSVSGRIWLSIQADTAGDATGVSLATSDKIDASKITTGTGETVRFVFRTPFTVAATTQYHLVLEGDYTRSDTVNIVWTGVAAGGYSGGVAREYNGSVWANASGIGDFNFKAYVQQNSTALTFPSGYDQSCKVGYVYANSAGTLNAFISRDRKIRYLTPNFIGTFTATAPLLTDVTFALPPTPVRFIPILGTNLTDTSLWIGGVPDAYDSVGTTVDGAGQMSNLFRYVDPRGESGAFLVGDTIPTETQAIYVFVSSSTGHIMISGFEW